MKPLEKAFGSILAPRLRDFVLEKRSLGFRYIAEQVLLQRFDRYLSDRGLQEETLPRTLLIPWLSRQQHERPRTQRARVGVTQQFVKYLNRHGLQVEMPKVHAPPLRAAPFVAHIFSQDEVDRLFAAVDQVPPDGRAPLRHRVMPVLFRMLYSTGLRVGEALHLQVQDVDLSAGVLTIRDAKFGKDRLVPISSSLKKRLTKYQSEMGARASEAVFLPAPDGGIYCIRAPYSLFRRLLLEVGIPHGGRGKGPRVHDFRHTFAVHRLEAWFREGVDMTSKLPVLAAYLGHKTLAGSQRYLQLTTSLLPDISITLDRRFGSLMPRRPKV